MAYPFGAPPTFAEFRNRLEKDYGCQLCEGGQINREPDRPRVLKYFAREVNGKTLTYVFQSIDDNDHVNWHLIRSVCKRLKIPFQKDNLFGLHLG